MIRSDKSLAGLASVTFRGLSPAEIIDLARGAGLKGIEWGGDVHVVPGDTASAEKVHRQTLAAGLQVVCYGSYHNLGKAPGKEQAQWEDVVKTAKALGAPAIRIWAGTEGTATTSSEEFASLVMRAREEAEVAANNGLKVVCEFHKNTLTDSGVNAARFISSVNHPAFGTLWQTKIGADVEENLNELRLIGKWLHHVHVFHWSKTDDGFRQRPLKEGESSWRSYTSEVKRFVPLAFHLIEFVRERKVKQFHEDAEILKRILADG